MKKKLLILIIISSLLLTGCWNIREVSDLGVAVALGIDLLEDDTLEVTAQVLVPRMLNSTGTQENSVITFSGTGKTIFEILRKLTNISSRKIYLAHVQLIVIGEGLAKSGIFQTIDFLERDHEFRRQALVVLSKDITAKEILDIESRFESLPAMNIVGVIENNIHVGTSRKVNLLNLFNEINSQGRNLVLPVISTRSGESPKLIKDLEAEGAGVLRENKLEGFLNSIENRGFLWVINELEGGILVVPSLEDHEKLIAMEILSARSEMDVLIKNSQLTLSVTVKHAGSIGEQQVSTDLTTKEMVDYLEKRQEEVIKREIQMAFSKAQDEFKSDIFGFGEIVRKNYPDIWKDAADHWDDIFSDLPVEINVTSKLEGSGQILKPSKNE